MAKLGLSASLSVLAAAALAGICGWEQQGPTVLWYRISTSAKALYALYTLPKEHMETFLKSYELFEKENYTGDEDGENIKGYYQVVNHLCAIGEVEKMYIPPAVDLNLGVFGNQMLWEEKGMADKLDVGAGQKVLDVGCGRGRIAHHVAKYTGAKVVGLNIDKTQIRMAEEHAKAEGMHGSQLEFVEGNYNHPLPFANGTFDALYHVQALTYVQDLDGLLLEMFRILKPGAKLSFLDWFKLDNYRPDDPYHRHLLRETKARAHFDPMVPARHRPWPARSDPTPTFRRSDAARRLRGAVVRPGAADPTRRASGGRTSINETRVLTASYPPGSIRYISGSRASTCCPAVDSACQGVRQT